MRRILPLFVALIASLQTIASAQPRPQPLVPPSPRISFESIDAAAKTVTLRETKYDLDHKILSSESLTVPLAANAIVVIREAALRAPQLKIGDTVTLLGYEPPVFPADACGMPLRSFSGAHEFVVIAISPEFPELTLRRGGPIEVDLDTSFLRTSFSNRLDGKEVGKLSLTAAQNGAGTVATLVLNVLEDLEFDRDTPSNLREMAALYAAKKIFIYAKLNRSPDGKREVTRIVGTKY